MFSGQWSHDNFIWDLLLYITMQYACVNYMDGVSKVPKFQTGDSTAHCSRVVDSRAHCYQA